MTTRFVIGDTHFGHANILQYEAALRPFATIEEHDEALIERWNSVVRPNDTVWHLGDVLFGKAQFPLLLRLNGHKRLVLGNHDNYGVELYAEHFERICGAAKIDGVLLSHVPIHPSQFYRFRGNMHGHMHSKSLEDQRYVNVSAEQIGLKPVEWSVATASLESKWPTLERSSKNWWR